MLGEKPPFFWFTTFGLASTFIHFPQLVYSVSFLVCLFKHSYSLIIAHSYSRIRVFYITDADLAIHSAWTDDLGIRIIVKNYRRVYCERSSNLVGGRDGIYRRLTRLLTSRTTESEGAVIRKENNERITPLPPSARPAPHHVAT